MYRGPRPLKYATPLERNRLIGQALEMRARGMQVQEVADALHIDRRTITYWVNPESAAKSRERARASTARQAARKRDRDLLRQHIPHMADPRPPDADYRARLAEIPPDDRSLTGRICGDPPSARSALAQRNAS